MHRDGLYRFGSIFEKGSHIASYVCCKSSLHFYYFKRLCIVLMYIRDVCYNYLCCSCYSECRSALRTIPNL